MNQALRLALIVLVPSAVSLACGSDEKSGNKNTDGGAAGGESGSGGAGTGTGGRVTLSDGGRAPIMGCDTKPCEALASQVNNLATACCVSETQCGLGVGTFCLPLPTQDAGPSEPIVTDPACKDLALPFGNLTLTGCCASTGVCGFTSSFGPQQCTDFGQFAGFSGASFDAGAPIPCGPNAHKDGGPTEATDGGPEPGKDGSANTPDASSDGG